MRSVDRFFVLRTPSVSIDRLLNSYLQQDLFLSIQDSLVSEAISIASPELYAQIQADLELESDKLRQSLLKYILRMGSRCTPFGLFAGCTVSQIASRTEFDLTKRQIERKQWLDMQVLSAIAQRLNQDPLLQLQLTYRPNTSLYQIGQKIRYYEVSDQESHSANFFLSELDTTSTVRSILQFARQGATRYELVEALVQKQCLESEALAFIDRLIEDQVLVSELNPNVTGPDCLSVYITILKRLPVAVASRTALQRIQTLLQSSLPSDRCEQEIREIVIKELGITLSRRPLVQTDCFFKGGINQLGQSIQTALRETFEKIASLAHLNPRVTAMHEFKQRFYARYEDREVPLMTALDAETGIGYGSTVYNESLLVNEILPNLPQANKASLSIQVQQWLLQHYTKWLETCEESLELTDQDLATLPGITGQLPHNYYALGYFLATSSAAIDQGDYQFMLKVLTGPSACILMGRFCRDDVELAQRVKLIFEQQQQTDPYRLYAEVAHLPSQKAGNVMQRPHLRNYEIPFLTASTMPTQAQINLDDLWISVPKGERVVLRSRRLGKEIIPSLTTAHLYQYGLPLYHFLGDLQTQEQFSNIHWNWGWLGQQRHLPRVQYQRIILSEARWRLDVSDLNINRSDVENIMTWRHDWRIPRFVAVVQTDQELFLDLDALVCQQLLTDTLRRLKTIQLIEWLRTPDLCPVNGPDGRLTHEIILPFSSNLLIQPVTSMEYHATDLSRVFIPGSEWLYLKVYCGIHTADMVVSKLGKLTHKWLQGGQITHWFFIRYRDPEPHVRIRWRLTNTIDNAVLLNSCQQILRPLITSEEIYRLQVDTYQREIERYGPKRMEATERIFWADSETVLQICHCRPSEHLLFTAALLGIEAYLTDFGYSLANKLVFCQQRFQSHFTEQSVPGLQQQLAHKYRANRFLVERVISQQDLPSPERVYQKLFIRRSQQIRPILDSLQSDSIFPFHYVASLLHLFINRLFQDNQRTYELLLYHHLSRGYKSRQVRSA